MITIRGLSERQKFSILALAVLFVLNALLTLTGVMTVFSSMDVPLHFLGGFFVAFFLIDLFRKALRAERGLWRDIMLIVGLTLVVGLAWEAIELLTDALYGAYFWSGGVDCCMGNLADTLTDLVMDGLGAAAAVFYVRRSNRRSAMFR